MIKNCEFCKSDFKCKRSDRRFCSRACSNARGKNVNSNVECATCGKIFHKSLSAINKSKSGLFFCSRKHKIEAQRIGGIREIMPSHYGDTLSDYRSIAFRNYPQKCNQCGYNKYPEVLVVHHIDLNHNNNDLSNLEILCPTHHGEVHFKARQI